MTIIVIGATGFTDTNIVKGLNERDETDIIAADSLTRVDKFGNIVDRQISDYLGKTGSVECFVYDEFGKVHAIFHEDVCPNAVETDGRYMMDSNYRYSLVVMRACLDRDMQFLYASSAVTYGASETLHEEPHFERPLNVYGYSKLLFDQIVRRVVPTTLSQIIGFRYFSAYGPREQHKGRMASVTFHNLNQFHTEGTVKLLGEYDGYPQGGQMRDFVSMENVVRVSLFLFDNPGKSGILNLGMGRARLFNGIATTVANTLRVAEDKSTLSTEELAQKGLIEYVKFPDALCGEYQRFIQADQSRLQAAGYTALSPTAQEDVECYCQWLLKQLA